MRKYTTEFESINNTISQFNKYLSPSNQIRLFDVVTDIENKNIIEVVHGDWNAFPWPNNATRGVYFVLGYERNHFEKNGMYIGKASFGSSTSARLYSHLHPTRSSDKFTMNGFNNEEYIVEYIASIDLEKQDIAFLSPALEEYLIMNLSNKLNLINRIGGSRGHS